MVGVGGSGKRMTDSNDNTKKFKAYLKSHPQALEILFGGTILVSQILTTYGNSGVISGP